jgi:hypothetical protein
LSVNARALRGSAVRTCRSVVIELCGTVQISFPRPLSETVGMSAMILPFKDSGRAYV